VLAYVFWHRAAASVHEEDYERALVRFHRSLSENPPAGFCSSLTLRAPELPWLAGDGLGYEDWYLVENWTALGVLEAAAVSRGHAGAHESAARAMGTGTGAVYRLLEGAAKLEDAHAAVWVTRPGGAAALEITDLLGDGFDPERTSVFQRSLVLGPAPEVCLLSTRTGPDAQTGVAATRLPTGWRAQAAAREPLVG